MSFSISRASFAVATLSPSSSSMRFAFAKAIGRDPKVNLYNPDKRHPSLAGSYLAACVIYAAVHGKNPVGNSHKGGLDPKLADFLQQVAADTVKEYFGKDL